jgi:hypothetical protein
MRAAGEVLAGQFAEAGERLIAVLAGIGDAEFFWEPVDGCWTVHDRGEPRGVSADGSGRWVIDYVVPEPSPSPVTTIAWRTVHVAAVNVLYWDYAFGPATATFDLELPGDAAGAVAWLRDSLRPLAESLAVADVDALVATNWGERWPVSRIFTTLIREQIHHGAEIALLRDLYRNRGTLRPG